MSTKTHQTAVAIIPPQEVWAPIQAIRQQHDRQFHRWMPHVNLLYPFYPAEQFDDAAMLLVEACAKISPLAVMLAKFQFFRHPSGRATLWLAPEPAEDLIQLQAALQAACPDCDDLSRFPAGFTPHLSVGQANSLAKAQQLVDTWQLFWQPIRWELSAVALIRRDRDGPFVIGRWVLLAAKDYQKGTFTRVNGPQVSWSLPDDAEMLDVGKLAVRALCNAGVGALTAPSLLTPTSSRRCPRR